MLTKQGKNHIRRFMAGYNGAIAQSIAFGIGTRAEADTDTKLQFEIGRSNVALTSFDFVASRLVFKAPIADDIGGTITEVALYSSPSNSLAGGYGSTLLTTFDSDTEGWADPSTGVAPTFTANAKIGDDSLRQAPAASVQETDALNSLSIDLSGYSGNDKFVFAFNVGNANTASVRFRFMTDAANYFDFLVTSPTAGYKIVELLKSSAGVVGTPDWGNITEIRVYTTATSGGAAQVDFDGIRIDDEDTINEDYVLVSRKVISSFTKVEGKVQEVEFSLDINL